MRVLLIASVVLKDELMNADLSPELKVIHTETTHSVDLKQKFDACIDLLFDNSHERIEFLKQTGIPLIVVNSVMEATERNFPDFVRINGWPGFLSKPILELAANGNTPDTKTEKLFDLFGKITEWVPDQKGFISARVISSIINEAFYTLEENVSTEEQIDTAMKLGTNYPFGPFEWARKIGLYNVFYLLTALCEDHERYRPSSLLKQKALA